VNPTNNKRQSTIDETIIQSLRNNVKVGQSIKNNIMRKDSKDNSSNVFYCPSNITTATPGEQRRRWRLEDPEFDNKTSEEIS
jgi:hypothetical protein